MLMCHSQDISVTSGGSMGRVWVVRTPHSKYLNFVFKRSNVSNTTEKQHADAAPFYNLPKKYLSSLLLLFREGKLMGLNNILYGKAPPKRDTYRLELYKRHKRIGISRAKLQKTTFIYVFKRTKRTFQNVSNRPNEGFKK